MTLTQKQRSLLDELLEQDIYYFETVDEKGEPDAVPKYYLLAAVVGCSTVAVQYHADPYFREQSLAVNKQYRDTPENRERIKEVKKRYRKDKQKMSAQKS